MTHQGTSEMNRLSLAQAAFVIARRDFFAVLFSRAFVFFLLGPLFPVIIGLAAGSIGSQVQREAVSSQIAVAMDGSDGEALVSSWQKLRARLGSSLPALSLVDNRAERPRTDGVPSDEAMARLLQSGEANYAAVLSGTLDQPVLWGTPEQIARWRDKLALLVQATRHRELADLPEIETRAIAKSASSTRTDRIRTAQAAQMLLFLLTMLLAGMVLSNLVEEKANKIIEILAAAIDMDAVFLGKLFAMLAVSFVGIAVWGTIGLALVALAGGADGSGAAAMLTTLPAPAVGWPLFAIFGVLYFAMAYLLLGALFLTIGAMAATVREVQTLSMPVTMLQLIVFFLAAFALTDPGSPLELGAALFPLSSPFAMLARAALQEAVWPHLLALAWQALWVAAMIRIGAGLFRKRVLKSGGKSGGKARNRRSAARGRTAARQSAEATK